MLESLGLKVKLPMVLEMDNQGAVYLASNWSIGGRTRHIDVRSVFLRELKEAGVLVIKSGKLVLSLRQTSSPRIWISLHSSNTPESLQEELKTIELVVHHTSKKRGCHEPYHCTLDVCTMNKVPEYWLYVQKGG